MYFEKLIFYNILSLSTYRIFNYTYPSLLSSSTLHGSFEIIQNFSKYVHCLRFISALLSNLNYYSNK